MPAWSIRTGRVRASCSRMPKRRTDNCSVRLPQPFQTYRKMRRYGAPPIALCAFEADLILGSTTFRSVRNKAITLRMRPEHARTQVPEQAETQFTPWVKAESFTLANYRCPAGLCCYAIPLLDLTEPGKPSLAVSTRYLQTDGCSPAAHPNRAPLLGVAVTPVARLARRSAFRPATHGDSLATPTVSATTGDAGVGRANPGDL